jgi:hypothetical protein
MKEKKQKKKKGPDERPSVKKPDTKKLVDTSDPSFDSASEGEDDRTGGRKIDPLLLKISKPCLNSDGKKISRCAGSAGCKTTWTWPRNKARILKHAMNCGYLAAIDASLTTGALEELAKKDPTLLPRLNEQFGLTSKRPRDPLELNSSPPVETPPLKRVKLSASITAVESTPQPVTADTSPQQNQLTKYRTEGKKNLEKKVNDALVELFICCGIAPRIIGRDEFKHFVNTLNGNYSLISRTTFEDSLVPAYAASVRLAVIQYLQSCWFLTVSCDGGKLKKKKCVTVHITTIHRQSFCVDLDDVSRLSQTGEYFAELLKKVSGHYVRHYRY